MAERVASLRTPRCLESVHRWLEFAAWPQARAELSWFQWLDTATGMTVSRGWGRNAGGAEQAVARALLAEAGTAGSQGLMIDTVPLWVTQASPLLRRHVSTVAALNLLPELRLAVRGDVTRQWDTVLGGEVRPTALLLCQTNFPANPPAHAELLRQQALSASSSSAAWDLFCLRLGLAALAEHGQAISARLRLAWPHALRHAEPLAANAAARSWLEACVKAVHELPQRAAQSSGEMAA
jgi:hypothetical protein